MISYRMSEMHLQGMIAVIYTATLKKQQEKRQEPVLDQHCNQLFVFLLVFWRLIWYITA